MSNITFVFINTVALTLILLKYCESSIINDFLDISKFIDVIQNSHTLDTKQDTFCICIDMFNKETIELSC